MLSQTEKGKRHPHQFRIPGVALRRALEKLHSLRLDRAKNFDDLLQLIDGAIRDIPRIGELVVYDVAHRLGAARNIEPDRVYLHAGTREGARALGLRGYVVRVDDLPQAFRRLTPAECEDCLCIYARALKRIAQRAIDEVA